MMVHLITVSQQVILKVPHIENFLQYARAAVGSYRATASADLARKLSADLAPFGDFRVSFQDAVTAEEVEFPSAEEMVNLVIDTATYETVRYH